MLIIPSVTIRAQRCTAAPLGEEGTLGKYPRDPVAVARMWRSENAKAMHVFDADDAENGSVGNKPLLRELTYAVDIPIQLSGGLKTYQDVKTAFLDLGVYRVVLGTAACADPELIRTLIQEFGPRKIVVSIDISDGRLLPVEGSFTPDRTPIETALMLKQLGVQRVLYHDADTDTKGLGPAFDDLRRFAIETDLSVTVRGMVRNYPDLVRLEKLLPSKIDSLILGEPLYINAFPCQRIWRIAEKGLIEQHRFF